MDDALWDERIAERYDRSLGPMAESTSIDPAVDVLAGFAGDGPALEFAIGTGRIGLPLSERGVEVHGIELSEAMVAQMRAKPGGDIIPVTVGDMASARADGEFTVVFLVFNTITNLLTQADQVACFRNAAAHLRPGGRFVIETFIPPLRRLPPGETLVAWDVSPEHVGVDEFDTVNQLLVSHHVRVVDGRTERFESPHRYGWPAEYDLMAELAGMSLEDRWADWRRLPFTADSPFHISVYRRR